MQKHRIPCGIPLRLSFSSDKNFTLQFPRRLTSESSSLDSFLILKTFFQLQLETLVIDTIL